MKKVIFILCVIVAWTLVLCGPTNRSGDKAKAEFESRNQVVVSPKTKDWKFSGVEVGDTYNQYFRFSCPPEEFASLTDKLALKSDDRSGRMGGGYNPNQPGWWKLPAVSQPVFHQEHYTNAAGGSAMSFWYDKESGTAFMEIGLWD